MNTELVHRENNKAFTTAQTYLDEISIMCEMYLDLHETDEFNHDNFNGIILNAISSLASISVLPESAHYRALFTSLKNKIYEWFSLTLDDDDDFTNEFKEGVYLTLHGIHTLYLAHSVPTINHSLISEKNYKDAIIAKWNQIPLLSCYELVKPEFHIKGGAIDILAKDVESNRDVLIELKKGNKSGHKQLHQYGFHFHNPILINISESKPKILIDGITYMVFSDLDDDLC